MQHHHHHSLRHCLISNCIIMNPNSNTLLNIWTWYVKVTKKCVITLLVPCGTYCPYEDQCLPLIYLLTCYMLVVKAYGFPRAILKAIEYGLRWCLLSFWLSFGIHTNYNFLNKRTCFPFVIFRRHILSHLRNISKVYALSSWVDFSVDFILVFYFK